jgi:hypothetical protein
MINEWDGKTLTIDNDSGSIEATRLAAGKKDSENRFSGVLLEQVFMVLMQVK